jgi:hypothetical protein
MLVHFTHLRHPTGNLSKDAGGMSSERIHWFT